MGVWVSAVSGMAEFELTGEERDRLVALARGESSRLAARARIVLALAELLPLPGAVVAAQTQRIAGRWVDADDELPKPFRPKGIVGIRSSLTERNDDMLAEQVGEEVVPRSAYRLSRTKLQRCNIIPYLEVDPVDVIDV